MTIKKWSLAACSILPLSGVGSTALAQSSVTLYGLIDSGITVLDNVGGGRQIREAGGVYSPNRWGVRGSEDLGGGTKALFRLEGGFNSSNGSLQKAGVLFNRYSTVGLEQANVGTINIGVQPDFMIRMLPVTGLVGPIYAYHPGDYDRVAGEYLSNTVSYESPRIGGVHAGVLYSFGDATAPATNTGRTYSGMVDYVSGPITAIAVTTSLRGVSINPGAIGLSRAFNRALAPTVATGILADSLTTSGVGLSYKFGDWRVQGAYTSTTIKAFAAQEKLRTGDLALFYQWSAPLTLAGNYTRSSGLGGKWQDLQLLATYAFSKRTSVYAGTVFQHVSGDGQKAALLFQGVSSTSSQAAYRIGLTTTF